MQVPLLDLKGQYQTMREEMRAVLDEVCDSQRFILGPKVEAFERNVARYSGAAHAVGLSSGTDALIAALMALNVRPGDAVITSPYTFFATVGSIVRVGATPVFADIDPVTYNLDPVKLSELLKSWPARFKKSKPKVLLPVHLYGQCADMDPLIALAHEHGLRVIEDAAQAIGAEYPSEAGVKRAGTMGDIGCFSFFPSKNLGGFGDGGMVTTNDVELAEKLKILRDHGSKPKYYHQIVGGNFRLDAIQAAVLDIKLTRLDSWHEARQANAAQYAKGFAGSKIATPKAVYAASGAKNHHIYNQYIVRVPDRDNVKQALQASGVGCEIYYPVPLHLQECFRSLGYRKGDFPESEKAAMETLAIPIYPELTKDMKDTVIRNLKTIVG